MQTHAHKNELNKGVNIPVAGNRVPENVNTYVERKGERREEGSESHRQLHEGYTQPTWMKAMRKYEAFGDFYW